MENLKCMYQQPDDDDKKLKRVSIMNTNLGITGFLDFVHCLVF
jgi:hypothetical protein